MAVPLPKHNELIERYNNIDPSCGEFQYRRLAKDSRVVFNNSQDPFAGIVCANCEFDIGNKEKAFNIIAHLTTLIAADPEDILSANIYLAYARMLGFTGNTQEAIRILNQFFKCICPAGQKQIGMAMSIYACADQYEKLEELNHSSEPKVCLYTPMLAYYLYINDDKSLLEYFSKLAYVRGITIISPQNIDLILDLLSKTLTHPTIKPTLHPKELEYLENTREKITEMTLLQPVEIHVQHDNLKYFKTEQVLGVMGKIMTKYDNAFRELAQL